jgi:hypothetical protein
MLSAGRLRLAHQKTLVRDRDISGRDVRAESGFSDRYLSSSSPSLSKRDAVELQDAGKVSSFTPPPVITQLARTVIDVRMIDVVRGEIGAGEQYLYSIFTKAKRNAPCIIFFDEFQVDTPIFSLLIARIALFFT